MVIKDRVIYEMSNGQDGQGQIVNVIKTRW